MLYLSRAVIIGEDGQSLLATKLGTGYNDTVVHSGRHIKVRAVGITQLHRERDM